MCVMLLYIILADLRRTKVFLKAVIPMVNALWRNFITKGPLTGLIIEDSRDSCVGLPVWCVNHATNFLFDQMLLLCNMPDSPKASKNSFKLLTSLVKNFSVDFKWNANSLAFFFPNTLHSHGCVPTLKLYVLWVGVLCALSSCQMFYFGKKF